MKAHALVKKLLEADLDFDPERYVRSTLFPKESEVFGVLRRLGFTPIEKRRVHTMWEKRYPHKMGGCYRLDVELEWQEGENHDRMPFWLSAIDEHGKATILTKYILLPRTLDYVLRTLDQWFTENGNTTDLGTARQRVENTMNYVRNSYRPQ